MATVSPRLVTNQEIQEEPQIIAEEIPLQYFQHCIEEVSKLSARVDETFFLSLALT